MTVINILTKKQVNEMIDKAIKQQSEKIYKSLDVLIKHIYRLEETIRCSNEWKTNFGS